MTTEIGTIEITSGARELAADLKTASGAGRKILPFSASRWQRFARKDNVVLVGLEEHQNILEHSIEDQVILVETGISLAALDQYLSRTGQWLPLSFGSSADTLLEAIVTGDGGALTHGFGGPRHLVLGLSLALSNGNAIRTGGRVVKNVTGYDLTRLIIGSYGIFAVPATAYLRLYARPERFLSISFAGSDTLRLLACQRSLAQLGLPIVCAELTDKRLFENGDCAWAKNDALPFSLLVRVAGAQALIESAVPLILRVGEAHSQSITTIEETRKEAEIWSTLTTRQQEEDSLELAINKQSFAKLWQQDKSLFEVPFSYRAGPGTAKFFLSLEEKNKFIAALSTFAENNAQSLTVAYSDTDYLRRVKHLGANSNRQDRLLDRLKQQFDPTNCLNPFVCLIND